MNWIDIKETGELPAEGERVEVAVENGNVCHPMDDCYQREGKWFKGDGTELRKGIDVYAWKSK